MDRIGLILKL